MHNADSSDWVVLLFSGSNEVRLQLKSLLLKHICIIHLILRVTYLKAYIIIKFRKFSVL